MKKENEGKRRKKRNLIPTKTTFTWFLFVSNFIWSGKNYVGRYSSRKNDVFFYGTLEHRHGRFDDPTLSFPTLSSPSIPWLVGPYKWPLLQWIMGVSLE